MTLLALFFIQHCFIIPSPASAGPLKTEEGGHMAKILLVEDVPYEQRQLVAKIDGRAEIVTSRSCFEVPQLLEDHPDIDVIIMDGFLDDGPSLELVMILRRTGCEIPIITSSGSEQANISLMEAGCSHRSNKDDSWRVALEILGIETD
jgi:CheY-like chemotaxis protein